MKISYDYDNKGNIVLPACAPFDGNPVLIRLAKGWCEAWWDIGQSTQSIEGLEYSGWNWVCMDDDFQADLDDALEWLPLPVSETEEPADAS